MVEIIKVGTAGFVLYKAFKVLGKKDYGDIIGFVTLLSVGFSLVFKINEWYVATSNWFNGLMNNKFFEMIGNIGSMFQ